MPGDDPTNVGQLGRCRDCLLRWAALVARCAGPLGPSASPAVPACFFYFSSSIAQFACCPGDCVSPSAPAGAMAGGRRAGNEWEDPLAGGGGGRGPWGPPQRLAAGAVASGDYEVWDFPRPSLLLVCVLQSHLVSVSEFPRADVAAVPHSCSSLHAYQSTLLELQEHYNDGRH